MRAPAAIGLLACAGLAGSVLAQDHAPTPSPLCMDRAAYLAAVQRALPPAVFRSLYDPQTGVLIRTLEPIFAMVQARRERARQGDAQARGDLAEIWARCRIAGFAPGTPADAADAVTALRERAANGIPTAVLGLTTLQATGRADGPADLQAAYQTLAPLERALGRTPPADAQAAMRRAFAVALRTTLQFAFDPGAAAFDDDADPDAAYRLRAAFGYCRVPVEVTEATPGLRRERLQALLDVLSARLPRTALVCATPLEGMVVPIDLTHPKARPPVPPPAAAAPAVPAR